MGRKEQIKGQIAEQEIWVNLQVLHNTITFPIQMNNQIQLIDVNLKIT